MASIKLFDYLFLTRPVLFFPVWTVFLAGIIQSGWQSSDDWWTVWLGIQAGLVNRAFWTTFLSLSLLMASIFIINQFIDMKSDRENEKLFLLADGLVSIRAALSEAAILLVLGFALAMQGSLPLFVLCLILVLSAGVGYSLPPFSWKDKPLSGLMVNMFGGLLTFLLGWQVGFPLETWVLIKAVPYMLAIGAVYLLTTIADRKGDELVGKRTFAVQYGRKKTVFAALILEFAGCVSAWILGDILILIPALAALPLFAAAFIRGTTRATFVASRSAILFLCSAVVVCFPAYGLLLLAVFLLSRWYYRNRFNLNYPTLSPTPGKE